MSTETNNPSLVEKVLAYSSLSIIALAIISFFATLIAALVGVERQVLAEGFWPVVTWIGYVGLPIGFVLIMTLLILTRRRRKREFLNEQR
ncbi:hypothetical protein JSO19_08745 [Leucobacter sp. UCMA 4100]|uniref:hypothetical protein n=1 Tax=Leucobacter sp. UCMA 4100 TaxID=2810534 RepID=UPI0022EB472A|nr:hypothetical protein [Leucobacter sp. UCMA 4100]MDA3147467.1 hypothetical protein [Leucobacter sp. UCMA 4100]